MRTTDGVVVSATDRRLRFRSDPNGVDYAVEAAEERDRLKVIRLNANAGSSELVGYLRRSRQGWAAERTENRTLREPLRLIARAWTRVPYLLSAREKEKRDAVDEVSALRSNG